MKDDCKECFGASNGDCDCCEELKADFVHETIRMTQITQRVTKEITWKEIVDTINSGKATEALQVKDIITDTMKDGMKINFEVAHIAEDGVYFVTNECYKAMKMNTMTTELGIWKETELRKRINSAMLNLMPDDLKEVITERTIRQMIKGNEYISQDKLWVPSITEIFGENDEDVEKNGLQFDIFKKWKNRMRKLCGSGCSWWTRSPNEDADGRFYYVYIDGIWENLRKGNSKMGVIVGFWIKKSE